MRIIHSGGFPEEERYQTRAVIYSNLVVAFKVLLDIMASEAIDFEHAGTKVCTGVLIGPPAALLSWTDHDSLFFSLSH